MMLIRHRVPGDDGFVFSSWLHSSRSAFNEPATDERYRQRRAEIAEKLSGSLTLVMCPPEDQSTILGWVCAKGDVLHYAYTRESSRKEGICRRLCRAAFGDEPFTCLNPTPRFKLVGPRVGCIVPKEPQPWAVEAK